MKKLYILLISIFFSNISYSQPTYTLANFPTIGTAITTVSVDPFGQSEGNSGPSQTWDFSTATILGNPVTATMISPAGSFFSGMFPTANIAAHTTSTAGNDAYAYYNNDANGINLIGAGTHSPTVDIVFSYSDPQVACTFPFTYNSTSSDNFVAFATYSIAGSTVQDYRRGSFTVTGDAYGTLITPDNTYPNSLRVKCIAATVDSILISGFPGASMSFDNNTYFSWSSATSFQSLFMLGTDTMDQGGGPVISQNANYSTITTGVNESVSLKPLEVFPNPAPALSRINLSADELDAGTTTFLAIDMQGRIAKQIEFILYPASHKSVSIDMSDCKSGIYFIRLAQNNKTFSTKFVMQ